MNPTRNLLATLALMAGMTAVPSSHAADALTDAMQAAYGPYRVVLFRTNSKAQAESEQAMAQARQAWAAIVASTYAPATLADRLLSSLSVGCGTAAQWMNYRALAGWLAEKAAQPRWKA